jgi:hypothetical protein
VKTRKYLYMLPCILLYVLIIFTCGCNKISLTQFKIDDVLQLDNEILDVSTKYSTLYKDGTNRQMFVFSSPVKEMENNKFYLFDNKLYNNNDYYETKNKEYNVVFKKDSVNLTYSSNAFSLLFNDINNIEKVSNYENIYGDTKESIKYVDSSNNNLYFIPTYNGLLMECELLNNNQQNEFDIMLDINKLSLNNDAAGYAQLLNLNGDKIATIYQAIVVDSINNIYVNNKAEIKNKNGNIYLIIDLSNLPSNINYPIKLSLSIDFYSEKMFYDTSVYEATPDTNCILNNISVFDSKSEKNTGFTYLKFNIESITPKQSSLLESFILNFYVMYVEGDLEIEIYKINTDWCSWTLNWNNKPDFSEKLGKFSIKETGWHDIDLTQYVKKLIDNNYDNMSDNSIVLKVKDENKNGYAIIASVDNTYAPPSIEVNYRVK